MTATLRLGRTHGQPPVRTFERGAIRALPPDPQFAPGAIVRLRLAEAVLRGTLTVPDAAEIVKMLGLPPGRGGTP